MSQDKPKSDLSERWAFPKDAQIRFLPEGHNHGPVLFQCHAHKDGKPVEHPCPHPDCIVREIMES